MSDAQMTAYFRDDFVRRNAAMPLAALEHEAMVISYNVQHHGPEVILGTMSELLNAELEGYRIYSHRNGYWFFCKREEWSNEEEVRLVLPRGKGSKVKIEPHWLTLVILGKDMADAHRTLIREWANQRRPALTVADAYYDGLHQVIRLR